MRVDGELETVDAEQRHQGLLKGVSADGNYNQILNVDTTCGVGSAPKNLYLW